MQLLMLFATIIILFAIAPTSEFNYFWLIQDITVRTPLSFRKEDRCSMLKVDIVFLHKADPRLS
jgi:hypothetical protein